MGCHVLRDCSKKTQNHLATGHVTGHGASVGRLRIDILAVTNRVPCHVHLFGTSRKHHVAKRYAADGDVKQAFASWLQTVDTGFCETDPKLPILTAWWSDVYHLLLPMCHIHDEVWI